MTINDFRRAIFHTLTRGIGTNDSHKASISQVSCAEIQRVLLCRPNGRLGNQLMMTPLVKEITDNFPHCKIDLFVKGNLSRIIFRNYPQVEQIISLPGRPFRHLWDYAKVWSTLRRHSYDLIVNVTSNSSSGRLATCFSRGKYKLYCELPEDVSFDADHTHMAKKPVYCLRNMLRQLGLQVPGNPVSRLDIGLTQEDLNRGARILGDLVKNDKPTISLYTFATGAKCFPRDWWMEFYDKLKTRFGNAYNFVEILPIENVSQIDFREISFYSRDLFEIAAVMANTQLYIGADCGIMHLAGAAHIPVLGLFSTTDPDIYQVYGPNSMAVKMDEITSTEEILDRVDTILKSKRISPN